MTDTEPQIDRSASVGGTDAAGSAGVLLVLPLGGESDGVVGPDN